MYLALLRYVNKVTMIINIPRLQLHDTCNAIIKLQSFLGLKVEKESSYCYSDRIKSNSIGSFHVKSTRESPLGF